VSAAVKLDATKNDREPARCERKEAGTWQYSSVFVGGMELISLSNREIGGETKYWDCMK